MVFLFTKRLLSRETDKLPSLLGLATEVAKFQNGTYYAGLWWEDMASGMLWFRGCAAELNKPSQYLAPSWSWASFSGWTLIYEDHLVNITLPDVVFRECYLEYKSDDPHGAIKSVGSIYPHLSSSWSSVKPQMCGGTKTRVWTGYWVGARREIMRSIASSIVRRKTVGTFLACSSSSLIKRSRLTRSGSIG